MRLCVLHNLYFYNTMMEEIRDALDQGRFNSYKEEKLYGMGQIDRNKENVQNSIRFFRGGKD